MVTATLAVLLSFFLLAVHSLPTSSPASSACPSEGGAGGGEGGGKQHPPSPNSPITITAAAHNRDRKQQQQHTILPLPWTASGSSFWIAGKTSTYCPSFVGQSCPPGNETVIFAQRYLYSEVPGGQQLYVLPTGEVKFAPAHVETIPTGAALGPFVYTPGPAAAAAGAVPPAAGDAQGSYTFTGFGADGFMACPVTVPIPAPSGSTTGSTTIRWQVFAAMENATVPSGKVEDCFPFDAVATLWAEVGGGKFAAWEYV